MANAYIYTIYIYIKLIVYLYASFYACSMTVTGYFMHMPSNQLLIFTTCLLSRGHASNAIQQATWKNPKAWFQRS